MSSCQYAKHPDEDEEGDGSREGREQQTVRRLCGLAYSLGRKRYRGGRRES